MLFNGTKTDHLLEREKQHQKSNTVLISELCKSILRLCNHLYDRKFVFVMKPLESNLSFILQVFSKVKHIRRYTFFVKKRIVEIRFGFQFFKKAQCLSKTIFLLDIRLKYEYRYFKHVSKHLNVESKHCSRKIHR